jgi:hypothetical protein
LPVPHDVAVQLPEHMVVFAQAPLEQVEVTAEVQAPVPLQTVAVVTFPLVQLAAAHWTELPG